MPNAITEYRIEANSHKKCINPNKFANNTPKQYSAKCKAVRLIKIRSTSADEEWERFEADLADV